MGNLSRFREWNVVDLEPIRSGYYQLDCQIEEHDENIEAILTVRRSPKQRIVWSEHFVASFENWRSTQWRIAQQLALAINLSLTTDRLKSCLRERPESRSVFDKWVLCNSLNSEWSPGATRKAISTLEEITTVAPQFAIAHSFLAAMHNKMHLVFPGIFRSDSSVAAALHHAGISMALDPLDSHTHRVLAWAKTLNGEYDVAEFHFGQALELNSANLHVRASCALGYAFLDNLEKACQIADETRRLPVPIERFHWGYFQNIYFLAGRLDDAMAAGVLAGDAISNLPAWQAAVHARLGNRPEAAACKAHFFDLTRQKWQGDAEPDEATMLKWLFHCFPIRKEAHRKLLQENLMCA